MWYVNSLPYKLSYVCAAILSPSDDPKAHVGEGVHFHDFTFAPEAGQNFQ